MIWILGIALLMFVSIVDATDIRMIRKVTVKTHLGTIACQIVKVTNSSEDIGIYRLVDKSVYKSGQKCKTCNRSCYWNIYSDVISNDKYEYSISTGTSIILLECLYCGEQKHYEKDSEYEFYPSLL